VTLDEYLNPERFPATTQKGLAPARQMMIDAFNFGQLKEFLANGGQMSESQAARWTELQEKIAGRTPEMVEEAAKRK
jgi:hypothetical protein